MVQKPVHLGAIYVGALIVAALFGLVAWTNRGFAGDDLEVLAGIGRGEYLSHWTDIFRDVSLDKWRPINNAFLFVSLRLFGASYPAFWIVNTLLVGILCGVVIWLFSHLQMLRSGLSLVLVFGCLLVLVTSPFSFMFRIGVFGFLEVAPLILVLLAFGLFVRPTRSYSTKLSAVLLGAAALIHERFLILSVLFGILALTTTSTRTNSSSKSSYWWFFLFPISWLYTTILVLRSNPLKGGGESFLDESVGLWVLGRVWDTVLFLSGSSMGRSIFYAEPEGLLNKIVDPVGGSILSMRLWSGVLWVALLAPWFVSYLASRRGLGRGHHCGHNKSRDTFNHGYASKAAVLCGLCLLLPAATVVSRIEMRWLYGSILFALVAMTLSILDRLNRKTYAYAMLGSLCILLSINVIGLSQFSRFNFFRENTFLLIDYIDSLTEKFEPEAYGVLVIVSDTTSYLGWSTNGGLAIELQASVKPSQVRFVGSDQVLPSNYCQKVFSDPCLKIVTRADSITDKVKLVAFVEK